MNDMDMIFLYKSYFREADLSFLEGIDRKKKNLEENNKEDDQNE